MSRDPNQPIGTAEAARMIGVNRRQLVRWAQQNFGPPYYRYNVKLFYRRHEVETWMQSNHNRPPDGSEGIAELLKDAKSRQAAVAEGVDSVEKTLVKRRAAMSIVDAEVQELEAALAVLSHSLPS